ncbi:hypothetical protein ACFQ0M_40130 [Kitasatospora aburaviensis]
MRWEQVYLAGTGVWLADRADAAAAVAAGAYDAREHAVNRIDSVSAATAGGPDDLAPPEMAVRAARTALRRAGRTAERIGTVFHSYLWFQGAELWPAAAYVAQHAVGPAVPAFDLLQQCNAGLSGMELAARQLRAGGPGRDEAVLLTTADRFAPPAFDRWRAERGMVYGDGGTAVVLSSSPRTRSAGCWPPPPGWTTRWRAWPGAPASAPARRRRTARWTWGRGPRSTSAPTATCGP